MLVHAKHEVELIRKRFGEDPGLFHPLQKCEQFKASDTLLAFWAGALWTALLMRAEVTGRKELFQAANRLKSALMYDDVMKGGRR